MNKYIKYFIFYPILIYIILLGLLGFNQKGFVYYPGEKAFEDCNTFKKEEQKIYKNTRFYEQVGSENLVIFFHGNAGRACDRSYIKSIFEKNGNSIIFPEYYGYSDKKNNPNFESIIDDVKNIGEYVSKQSKYKNIFIVGRSVGTGPASYFAQNYKTDKLLLISPYSALYKIGKDQYPFFPVETIFTEDYRPEEYLKEYKNELLIIHGINDKIVPIKYGVELFEGLNSKNKQIIKVENTGHNDIIGKKEVDNTIINYLR